MQPEGRRLLSPPYLSPGFLAFLSGLGLHLVMAVGGVVLKMTVLPKRALVHPICFHREKH